MESLAFTAAEHTHQQKSKETQTSVLSMDTLYASCKAPCLHSASPPVYSQLCHIWEQVDRRQNYSAAILSGTQFYRFLSLTCEMLLHRLRLAHLNPVCSKLTTQTRNLVHLSAFFLFHFFFFLFPECLFHSSFFLKVTHRPCF